MHDDRAYVFVLCCWWIRKLREDDEFGDGAEIDYGVFFGGSPDHHNPANDQWSSMFSKGKIGKSKSPF